MMNRFSLNTWTLHEHLGTSRFAQVEPSDAGPRLVHRVESRPPQLSLLDVPASLAERGIGAVDICYYHIPSTDPDYLTGLRDAIQGAGIELFCLLIDFGDLTQPNSPQRDLELEYAAEWIKTAAFLGAKYARPVAGSGSSMDSTTLEQAVDGYTKLATVADEVGVRLLTENIGTFAQEADALLTLLDRLEGRVGLVADFGNGRKVGEYDQLKRLLARADSVHAKPEVTAAGTLEASDFITCVEYAENAGFTGPYTIVYRGPEDPWKGIERTKLLIEQAIAGSTGAN